MSALDIYRAVIRQRLFGSEVDNVMWFRERAGSALPSGNNSATLANDFRAILDTPLRSIAQADMVYEAVQVTRMVPFGDGPVEDAWPAGTLGTDTTGADPHPASAAVITLYTSKIGRSRRGRIYLAGINPSNVVAGLWNSGVLTKLATLRTAITNRYGPLGSGSFELGVWSKKLAGPDPPYDATAFEPITSLAVRSQIRSQRRRQVGVGR